MDDVTLAQHNEVVSRMDAMVALLRRGSHYQAFRFNTGSNSQCHVQKQHSFIDGIHNPNATNTTVTLKEDGVVVYQNTLAPGDTVPAIGMPFMRECVLITDGNAVTIWGRIRA